MNNVISIPLARTNTTKTKHRIDMVRRVAAMTFGDFAVHRRLDLLNGWIVTHVPSGRRANPKPLCCVDNARALALALQPYHIPAEPLEGIRPAYVKPEGNLKEAASICWSWNPTCDQCRAKRKSK